jgi:hypothetical protein
VFLHKRVLSSPCVPSVVETLTVTLFSQMGTDQGGPTSAKSVY